MAADPSLSARVSSHPGTGPGHRPFSPLRTPPLIALPHVLAGTPAWLPASASWPLPADHGGSDGPAVALSVLRLDGTTAHVAQDLKRRLGVVRGHASSSLLAAMLDPARDDARRGPTLHRLLEGHRLRLVPVPVTELTSRPQPFRCVPYSATISAATCLERQRRHGRRYIKAAPTGCIEGESQTNRTDCSYERYGYLDFGRCRDCQLGRQVQQVLAEASRGTAVPVSGPAEPPSHGCARQPQASPMPSGGTDAPSTSYTREESNA